MKQIRLSSIWTLLAIVMFLTLLCSCSRPDTLTGKSVSGAGAQTLKIGFLDTLTGPTQIYGITGKNVAQIAVDEINTAGGISGKRLELVYEDGKCDGAASATAGRKLIEIDRVKAIIGFSCSNMVFAVTPFSEPNHVALITSYSTNANITQAGDFVFRNNYNDLETSRLIAEMVLSKARTAAILSENQEDTIGIENQFVQDFEESGKIVSREHFDYGAKDMRGELVKIISAKPEAVVINPVSVETGGPAIRQLRELGYTGPLFTNWILSGAGPSMMGIDASYFEGAGYTGEPSITTPKKEALFKEYILRYNEIPAFDIGTSSVYDALYLIKAAIEKNGESGDGIARYLYSMGPYEGALGNYTFDSGGDVTGVHLEKRRIVNGKSVSFE